MKDRAYAKINLSLNVIRRREDGYHDLSSVMLPLDFYDELEMEKADEMSYSCNKNYIKFNEKNTIVKAVNLMKEKYGITDNFKITLKKRIPIKAGLAGGSTDAASIIRMMNKMYDLKMSKEEIKEVTGKIGADVIFVYYSRPALVEGVGEELTFFDMKKNYYVLLVKPTKGVSTKDAYEKLNIAVADHPDTRQIKEKLEKGEDFISDLGNSLEESALRLCKPIKRVKEMLLEAGSDFALMSGSGSTVFTTCEKREKIEKIAEEMKNNHFFVRICQIK